MPMNWWPFSDITSPEMPDPLVFMSWWNEEVATPVEFTPSGQGMGVRRQVRLQLPPLVDGAGVVASTRLATGGLSLHAQRRERVPRRVESRELPIDRR